MENETTIDEGMGEKMYTRRKEEVIRRQVADGW